MRLAVWCIGAKFDTSSAVRINCISVNPHDESEISKVFAGYPREQRELASPISSFYIYKIYK